MNTGAVAENRSICSVVVSFRPDDGLLGRLEQMRQQSSYLVVVDNNSTSNVVRSLREWTANNHGTELIALEDNIGLAAALNRGLQRARELGFQLAISYDQDSVPEPGMVARLLEVLDQYPRANEVAVVGPKIVDRNAPVEHYRWLRPSPFSTLAFERVSCNDGYRDDVSFVITSGSLLQLDIYEQLGGFQEDLFIDYVDHEYCLRAKANGYRILVSGEARLQHALGEKREVRVGGYSVRPTFHAAERLYYIYRNRIPLIRRYGLREPHWLLFDLLATSHNLLRIALFENDRRRKLTAALEGTLDGLRGRMGARRSHERKVGA